MNWFPKESPSLEFAQQFPEYSPFVRQLLWSRGLKTQEKIDEFFNPDYGKDLHDPFLLKNLKKAVQRIRSALDKKEKIVIYGDYDADGVCGSTIIFATLQKLGATKKELRVYIPDRQEEGYGLHKKAIEELADWGANLIITVDTGTTNVEEVEFARKLGVDVIIVDHHQVLEKLPRAYALLNPHQKQDKYPFKHLAGTGVAFKLAQALLGEASQGKEKWLLDLVALATITDVMPLLSENRTLVKYGLYVLAHARRPGLRALMEAAAIAPRINSHSAKTTNISPFTLGFILGPRLNAAGRVNHADISFKLLNAESQEEARGYAREVEGANRERKKIVEKIFADIEAFQKDWSKENIIFAGSENWPLGVAGLVAGKIAEKYWKPAFIYQISGDKIAGSARGVQGVDLVAALDSAKKFLLRYGGHPQAAGFTADYDKKDQIERLLGHNIKKQMKDKDTGPLLFYDYQLSPTEIRWNLYDEKALFEPLGEANPEPVFRLNNARIQEARVVGNGGSHLRLWLATGEHKRSIKAMGFNMGGRAEKIQPGSCLDILCNLSLDEWNGRRELMLRIIDFKKL